MSSSSISIIITVTTSNLPSSTSSAAAAITTYPSSGVSSSLYLFTFLITILVLGLISGSLLGRAYFIRRRFQRRVEAAIRTGEPLPQDAAEALGLVRPAGRGGKKEKKVGPMPGMWEAEMFLDRSKGADGELEKGWGDVTPLSVLHFPGGNAPPSNNGPSITLDYPLPRPRFFGLLSPQPFPRPLLEHLETSMSLRPPQAISEAPPPGSDVSVGILIALPYQQQGNEVDRWIQEDEDQNVPEVVLGVMEAKVVDGR